MKKHLILALKITTVFVIWVGTLQLLALTSTQRVTLPQDRAYEGIEQKQDILTNGGFMSKYWQRFDSNWYLNIAQRGYYYQENVQSSVVFFPLYPILISTTSHITGSASSAGILVSLLSAFVACLLLYKLAEEWGEQTAWRAILLLLTFPAAFFLIAIYTESLFICLSVAAFYAAKKQKWLLAGIAGLLLSATRVTGVLILFPLIWEFARQNHYEWKKLLQPKILTLALIPLGLIFYASYLQAEFGSTTVFLDGQTSWQRNSELSIEGTQNAFTEYKKEFDEVKDPENTLPLATRYIDVAFTIIFITGTILAWITLPGPYALFATLMLLVPLASGRLESMPRYALSAFPLFLAFARISKNQILYFGLILLGTIFLSFLATLFVQFYWIA